MKNESKNMLGFVSVVQTNRACFCDEGVEQAQDGGCATAEGEEAESRKLLLRRLADEWL